MANLTKQEMYLLASNQFSEKGLSKARAAGYSLSEARAAGYSLSEARAAGYSLSEARAAGYSLSEALAAGYSLSEALAAGYSLSEALAAGYSLSEARAAGYSLSEARAAGYSDAELKQLMEMEETIPKLEKPYTTILAGIKSRERIHNQSTFGPEEVPEANVCHTPMCTAGHLVNLAGPAGYALKDKMGWRGAAALIHYKAHPTMPPQNFETIPQEWAMAYIEHMAAVEAGEEG